MLKAIYFRLTSLNLGLWLMTGVMVTLALGSFSSASSEQGGLNDMPLLFWLQRAPLGYSWWLWLCVACIAVLFVNALICSIDALRRKGRSVAPHLMHAGFLLIVLAHLLSAYGGLKQQMQLPQGDSFSFPDGERAVVESITGQVGPMGMMSGYRAELRLSDGLHAVQPNQPFFHKGYGIYVKDVALSPVPVALFEVHKEPGALTAFIGALLFTVGNLMLLAQRKGR
ncbi:cytochrome c biogenesis protein ResB [Geomonas propionica]|uniref:Cytochrome c biogenesis protein ResB n=1 Tax=Geomonas propionica TaxID=2798582 RepID=A0ABS0YLN0_9BACT|nr:cytochrome c biogenesis protein ResB [Geomonas propionica]MBJ6798838.1 cytochrome c biogenesis protein ResB [Geomonas propionica]